MTLAGTIWAQFTFDKDSDIFFLNRLFWYQNHHFKPKKRYYFKHRSLIIRRSAWSDPNSNKIPRALTVDEIKATVNDYRIAAANAKEAGFSGVEVHSASGYLINQFLDSKTNLRTDNYGGSLENKYRFLKEVMAAVLEVWPSNRVGVRLSPNGVFNDMGSPDFRETFIYAIKELKKFNLAYVHIMDGLAFGFHEQGGPMTLAEFRAEYNGIIMGNCGYTKEIAEKRLIAGHADLAAFGRPFITNPDLPERMQNNWPLTPFEDISLWYTPGAEGYTDYKYYQ